MPRDVERAAVEVLSQVYGPPLAMPEWLIRPGKAECGARWDLVREIYHRTTGLELPETMRPVERRQVDGVFGFGDRTFVFELDETQHFNQFRATTLRCYPADVLLAFDKEDWVARCERKTRLEGGGFSAPRPPLFPGAGGRHLQRAFRDALATSFRLSTGSSQRSASATSRSRPGSTRKTQPSRWPRTSKSAWGAEGVGRGSDRADAGRNAGS
jgi:hypothetical protein